LAFFPGYGNAFFIRITSEVAVKGYRKIVHGIGGIIQQLTQIFIDYSSMVNPREITIDEIRFFYAPLIDGLCERQKINKG
jgi:hypothetical protein